MPQRNGQNPIRAVKVGGQQGIKTNDGIIPQDKSNTGICPACKAEVPPKPGFRLSSLKCPKCGASMAKK
ncbi:MAG: hypothetical protein ABII64_08680 [Elusimicrobiota bacterium]